MEISLIGLLVCASIWFVGWLLGSPVVIGLIASVAFGTTSAMTISALGGSSPLIYFVFAGVLLVLVAMHRNLVKGLTAAFASDWVPWVICAIILYCAAGAIVMPRLFAGATSAFVSARDTGVAEVALVPNSGNVTQTGYFILGALTSLALLSALHDRLPLSIIYKGFMLWATINALGGVVDLAAKTGGAGDVFLPIRTATFAFLTDTEQGGFWRINGLYSEASAFAQSSMASLAFTFTVWKYSGSKYALLLAVVLLVLLVLSTSSTAYAGLTVLTLALGTSLVVSLIRGRLTIDLLAVALCIAVVTSAAIFILIYDQTILDPFQHLFQTTVLDKAQSESGRERSYWNAKSLLSVLDTWGLGVGFGSSRASNWVVAALSQLGIIGTGLQFALLLPFVRRPRPPAPAASIYPAFVLHNGLCACTQTWLLGCTIAGGSADPGVLFFVALAAVLACQSTLKPRQRGALAARDALGSRRRAMPELSRGENEQRLGCSDRGSMPFCVFGRQPPPWR